jgi:hypothetical protein
MVQLGMNTGGNEPIGGRLERMRADFRIPAVVIWCTPGSTREGIGSPGDGFEVDEKIFADMVSCGDGEMTNVWYHGRDIRTGVAGWVSACFLVFS